MTGKRQDPWYQAQAILARRDHSEYEVRQKLSRRGFPPEQVDEAVAKLKEYRMLSDENFAAAFVASQLAQRPVGPFFLIHQLRKKGVAAEVIEPAVLAAAGGEHEEPLAREAAAAWRRLVEYDKQQKALGLKP